MAPPYLTPAQCAQLAEDLAIDWILSDRFSGRTFEERLARALGTEVAPRGGNRPVPDLVDGTSVKTVGVRARRMSDLRGGGVEFIMSRLPVEALFAPGERLRQIAPDRFGRLCLGFYNQRITDHGWRRLSFLLHGPVDGDEREFLYWETPARVYDPGDYWWRDTGRGLGADRNLAGYPHSVRPDSVSLPRPSFSWTSRGKQFYVRHHVPADAQLIRVRRSISRERAVALLRAEAAVIGRPLAA